MKFHDTLNEKLFNIDTMEMLPEVKEKLEEIADTFIEFLEIPTDAVLDKVITGSSASYNYNEFSDLDLHIIVDYDKVHEDCPLVNGYLNSLKKQFNDNHDITIHGVPVELYAEQKDQGTVHNGLYSLQTGWIDKPQKIAPTDNDAAVEAKYNEIKELVDKCDDSEEATELLEKIYNMRKAGLAEAGEFCTENLAFKKLRNEGCMDKLRKIKKEQIDKQLSLESYNEAVKELNSSKNEKLIKQIFPQATYTFVMLDNDRGHISFELPIEGGREDNEFVIWIFNNKIDIRYTNDSLVGIFDVAEIETDINFLEFESKLTEILEMVKPYIENYYKKLVQEQTTITSEEDEDVIDNYLKMLLDNGHVVDTPDSQYVVQVFTNKKLQKLVEFDDIRKAAETFIEFIDIYTKDEDVVLFKQMRDNGKDIKTIDSTWLNVSNKNESIKEDYDDIAVYNAPEEELYELSAAIRKYGDGRYYINFHDKKNGEGNLTSCAGPYNAEKEAKQAMKRLRPDYTETEAKNESLNKLEETLKRVKDMEINEGMWASPFTMENAKQIAELLAKPITYEELNSEEGKQKYWNIIGDDEFWDNVADEAFDNPEEDARYLIVKFLEDWMERKESFNDDAYSQEAENIIKKAIFMFNGITEDMATLEKKVDTADNDLHDIIASLENTMSEALKE